MAQNSSRSALANDTDYGLAAGVWTMNLAELTRMAEAGGFETVWIGEHHAMEYTISPSPIPLPAYLAGQTSTIRLGAGTIIAPFWNPIRAAGECALLDVVPAFRALTVSARCWNPLDRAERPGYSARS